MFLSAALAMLLCACGAEPTQPAATLVPTQDPAATIAEVGNPDGTLKLTVGDSVQLGTATDPSAGRPAGREVKVAMRKIGPYTQVSVRSTADFDARKIVASTAVLHTATGAPVHVARRPGGGLIMAMQGRGRATAYYYFSTAALAPGRTAPPFSSLVFEATQSAVGRVVGTVSGTAPTPAPGRWTSTAPRIVTVSASGLAVARSAGAARLVWTHATAADTVPVRVTAPAPPTPSEPSTPPAPTPTGDVYTVPASIRGDCRVDVTRAMQAWIKSVPDGSTLLFGKGACYRIDGGLVITDRHDLTFEGNGATFQVFSQGDSQRSNWSFRRGSDIMVHNMIVRGANPAAGTSAAAYVTALEWQHGFRFEGTQGATLDSVQVYDVYGDFVEAQMDKRGTGLPARDITVRKSHFERNGRMGIGLTDVDGFTLEDSYLGDIRWSAVDLELNKDGTTGRNIRIVRNRFGPVRHALFSNHGAGSSEDVGNIVFSDNEMVAAPVTCMPPVTIGTPGLGVYWSGYTIENNRLRGGGVSIDLLRTRDVVVRNNVIASAPRGCGGPDAALIRLQDSHRGEVRDNSVSGKTVAVSVDSLSTGIIVSGNTIQ
ncbi:MAG TPA: hypothetical protein VFL93_02400 [Longimicrobiaceae bacterium]|nr:hypothetical protein [Longimicrobiaceae bacterium]